MTLPIPRMKDYLPDPRRPSLQDIRERYLYLRGNINSQHTSLSVSDTVEATKTTELQRVRSVEVGEVSGGTVTVQVYVDGRPVFLDAERPVSGGGSMAPSNRYYNFPAGSVVKTVIEATSGVPAGSANVVIDTEPFVLVPIVEDVKLKGRQRLKHSERVRVRYENEVGTGAPQAAAFQKRTTAAIGDKKEPTGAGRGNAKVVRSGPGHLVPLPGGPGTYGK